MANVTLTAKSGHLGFSRNQPCGNASTWTIPVATTSAGVVIGGTKATALAISDVLMLHVIPAGTLISSPGFTLIVHDAFTASSTMKFGFAYVDGVDSTAVPQDDDYFLAATALDAAAVTVGARALAPVVLPKDAYLVGTLAGAALDAVGKFDIQMLLEFRGGIPE